MPIYYVTVFYILVFHLYAHQLFIKNLLCTHHCVKSCEALRKSDMGFSSSGTFLLPDEALKKRLWHSEVWGDWWPSCNLGGRIPGTNDIYIEKMKDEREIIMTEWYGVGLEEGMSSRQNIIGKERSRVLRMC